MVNVCNLSGGGEAFNVVPDEVKFGGTVRAFSDETMAHLRGRLQEVVSTQAQVDCSFSLIARPMPPASRRDPALDPSFHFQVHGCLGNVDFREDKEPYFPPVINDADATDFARCESQAMALLLFVACIGRG